MLIEKQKTLLMGQYTGYIAGSGCTCMDCIQRQIESDNDDCEPLRQCPDDHHILHF
jgi:hypothetical protein